MYCVVATTDGSPIRWRSLPPAANENPLSGHLFAVFFLAMQRNTPGDRLKLLY